MDLLACPPVSIPSLCRQYPGNGRKRAAKRAAPIVADRAPRIHSLPGFRMPTPESIRHFWDSKAAEDPYWFVSSYGPYGGARSLAEFWESGRRIWEDIKRETGYRPSKSHCVVEIGCGVGRLTQAIAPEVGFVESLDISERMLSKARSLRLANVRYYLANGFDLRPLADHTADLVLAYCVFQHLPSQPALTSYLREMARVARPGALIAFTLTPRSGRSTCCPSCAFAPGCATGSGPTVPRGFTGRSGSASGLRNTRCAACAPSR